MNGYNRTKVKSVCKAMITAQHGKIEGLRIVIIALGKPILAPARVYGMQYGHVMVSGDGFRTKLFIFSHDCRGRERDSPIEKKIFSKSAFFRLTGILIWDRV